MTDSTPCGDFDRQRRELRFSQTAAALHRGLREAYMAVARGERDAAEAARGLITDSETQLRRVSDFQRDLARITAIAGLADLNDDAECVLGGVADRMCRAWIGHLVALGDPRRAEAATVADMTRPAAQHPGQPHPPDGPGAPRRPGAASRRHRRRRSSRSTCPSATAGRPRHRRRLGCGRRDATRSPAPRRVHVPDWGQRWTEHLNSVVAPWPHQLSVRAGRVALTAVVDHSAATALCGRERRATAGQSDMPVTFDVGEVALSETYDLVRTAAALCDGTLDAQQAWDAAAAIAATPAA